MTRKLFQALTVVGMPLVAGPLSAQQATWIIDEAHSAAQFSVRHLMISNVKGEFTKTSGSVVWDGKDLLHSGLGGDD